MPPPNVFITGANSGIGAALARHYAAAGATVGLFARRRDGARRARRRRLPQAAGATYAGDVRDARRSLRAAADFVARFGAPDIVIANAGISRGTVTGERDEDLDDFRAVFDTNVLGHGPHVPCVSRADAASAAAARSSASRALPDSAACPARRVQRVQGRGDHLPRESARRASRQRHRGASPSAPATSRRR